MENPTDPRWSSQENVPGKSLFSEGGGGNPGASEYHAGAMRARVLEFCAYWTMEDGWEWIERIWFCHERLAYHMATVKGGRAEVQAGMALVKWGEVEAVGSLDFRVAYSLGGGERTRIMWVWAKGEAVRFVVETTKEVGIDLDYGMNDDHRAKRVAGWN